MIDTVQREHDFKVLCDGLLRFELGRLVQTYGGQGADAGVDAQFVGAIDGVDGRWVFQYKFRSPLEALSARRAWLLRRFLGSKQGEFDKAGVKGADGYILLTNVPVTVPMVDKLTKAWRSRNRKALFRVWDASRLNVMLKGREHLARSWTGQKEARCRQALIMPTWQWVQAVLSVTLNWKDDALWPLAVESYQWQEPLGAFSKSFTWHYGQRIVVRAAELAAVEADPQFVYASSVAYPNAMAPFSAVRSAVAALADAVLREVEQLREALTSRLPELQQFEGRRREEITRTLAYCVAENRWGFPMRGLHSLHDGQLLVQGSFVAWQAERLPDLGDKLDELVREVPHGTIPDRVVAHRKALAALVQEWWVRLWYVVELGIDAEDPPVEPPPLARHPKAAKDRR